MNMPDSNATAVGAELASGSRSIGTFDEIRESRFSNHDRDNLARFGKQESLKRRFGFLSLFGFSCTILITWETALALFTQVFQNGGSGALAWGFLISWGCSLSVYMCIAEMASMAPIAGGQYFWVSILAPLRYKRFMSYITGWLTTIAWVATLATGSLYVGTVIQGLLILNYPDFSSHAWQGTLLTWAVIAVGVFINTVIAGLLPFLEGLILLLHILGFITILIVLAYLSPHVPASQVFFSTYNGGNWPSQGLSFCIGYIGNVATFVGADAAVHMAEEIENPAVNVPRAIFATVILNGAMGYAILLALLFALDDVGSITATKTGFPFIQVFYNLAGYAGANGMTTIIIALGWCASIGFIATASRMLWSFARDKGLPFHRVISQVNKRTKVPIIAVGIITVIPCLLVLIYIGSETAYSDVISLSVSGLYASYLVPCSLLFWRRVTGQIQPHESTSQLDFAVSEEDGVIQPGDLQGSAGRHLGEMDVVDDGSDPDEKDVLEGAVIEWGPWKVPGLLGTVNNGFACLYCMFVLFWDFWPPSTPTTAENMNYSVLVTGTVIIFSIMYYYVWGKRQYKGPLIDNEVKGVARRYVVRRNRE